MFKGKPIAVGTSAVNLTAVAESDTREGRNFAMTCDVDVWLDGVSTVTSGAGANQGGKLAAGTPLNLDLTSGEQVWAIATGAGTAQVFQTGV
jgi:hypothetical protein